MSEPPPTLPKAVLDMPGRRLLESLRLLGGIVRILRGNAHDLLAWLAQIDDVSVLVSLWDVENREAFDRHLNETERLLFNVAAAVGARVDYYQALRKRGHLPEPLAATYAERCASTFAADPQHAWLKGLRNYMLHHRLPPSFGRMTFVSSDRQLASSVVIETATLVNRSEFSTVAKGWMRATPEVDVRLVVAEYLGRVNEFDEWFARAFAEQHLADMETFQAACASAAHRFLHGGPNGPHRIHGADEGDALP